MVPVPTALPQALRFCWMASSEAAVEPSSPLRFLPTFDASISALLLTFVSMSVSMAFLASSMALYTVSPETRFASSFATLPSFFAETVYVTEEPSVAFSICTSTRSPAFTVMAPTAAFLMTVCPSAVILERSFRFLISVALLAMFDVLVEMLSALLFTCPSRAKRLSPVVLAVLT